MKNREEKKPDQIKAGAKEKIDAATSTGLGPGSGGPGAAVPHEPLQPVDPMYAPFDPVQTGGLPPYPGQPGFNPGYHPGYPPHPGYPNHPGCPDCPGKPGDPSCPGMELARAYFCIQRWGKVNTPARALETGTLFPELYRPYPR